jgi:glycosyltransferase involved in cell wall biosynthesis
MIPAGAVRVAFAPFLPANPYQRLLAGALERRGVVVRGIDAAKEAADFLPLVREFQPHVLHFHWLHHFLVEKGLAASVVRSAAFFRRLGAARQLGARVVVTAHNLTSHEALHPALEAFGTRRVLRAADAILAHCEAARREVAAFASIDAARVDVVPHGHYIGAYPPGPHGADRAAARRALGLDARALVFLSLGRVRAYKGLLEAARAFAAAPPSPDALLLIAGKERTDAAQRAFQEQVAPLAGVRFDSGFVADDAVSTYMAAADACLLPYRDVLTSGAAVLAMSFGKPVVAPRLGCLGESLAGQDALLYDADAKDGLHRALSAAAAARDRLPAIGAANRARAEQWDWDAIAEQTMAAYERAGG